MPIAHEDSLETVPSLAMVFFNDCLFIAHELPMLGYQCHTRLPSTMKEVATFMDLVPLFRELGQHHAQLQIAKQRDVLLEFVESAGGLGGTTMDDRFESVERAMKKVVHHLTQLGKVWRPILPRDFYCSTMGGLINAAIDAVLRALRALHDISEPETHQLHYLCGLLLRLSVIFEFPERNGERAVCVAPEKHVPLWVKLNKSVSLLEMSLVNIVELYQHGGLASFELSELHRFIKALFADTPHREASLKKIV